MTWVPLSIRDHQAARDAWLRGASYDEARAIANSDSILRVMRDATKQAAEREGIDWTTDAERHFMLCTAWGYFETVGRQFAKPPENVTRDVIWALMVGSHSEMA